jgi:type I restriction-modification system DNA methylase subunit
MVKQHLTSKQSENRSDLIWSIANKLVGLYRPHEYGKVILPFTVIKQFGDTLDNDQFSGFTFDLQSGDAGSGQSEIRRYLIENDWLEAIVQMPNDLFYNTGIATYIWLVSKNKEKNASVKSNLIKAKDINE